MHSFSVSCVDSEKVSWYPAFLCFPTEESQLCLKPQPIQGKRKKKNVYRCSRGSRASDEATSCRLGQIRTVALPKTRGNVIPAISRRSVKKRRLHCGGGCWFKPATVIKQQQLSPTAGRRARAAWSTCSAVAAGVLMWLRCEYLKAWIWFDCEGCCGLWGSLVCAFLSVTLVLNHRC